MTSKELAIVAKALNTGPARKMLKKMGVTNAQICSARSVRFDLPEGKAKDGINRVKLTGHEDGTLRIQLLQVSEVDLIDPVLPENFAGALAAFTGIGLEE